MSSTSTSQESSTFRQYLPDLKSPRFTTAAKQTPYEYVDEFETNRGPPWIYKLTKVWEQLLEEPYKGVTNDGTLQSNLFQVQNEDVPIDLIVAAANTTLHKLSPEQKSKVSYPVNAKQWRCWSNPEFLLRPLGLRLEEVPESVAESILSVIEATFSHKGYQKALGAMRVNHFLGEICDVPKIMNKYSYNFLIFGTPSTSADEPWGWSLYGHHLCLNVFLKGPQIFISPTFTGAEPNIIDTGEFKGTSILHPEGEIGLDLMQSLPEKLQTKATVFKELREPGMHGSGEMIDFAALTQEEIKNDRWNRDDQRHVCGAFRDNRIVPYEGVCVAEEFDERQQQLILDIAEQFLLYLPDTARKMKKEQIQQHFGDTYFCWIGGHGDDDAFYYRVQSPVIILEFDHHSGVFLSNAQPAKFHTHTIMRTPNAGDYGCAVRRPEEMIP